MKYVGCTGKAAGFMKRCFRCVCMTRKQVDSPLNWGCVLFCFCFFGFKYQRDADRQHDTLLKKTLFY